MEALKCSNCKSFVHNESSCQVKEVPNQVGSPVKKQVWVVKSQRFGNEAD